MVSVLQSGRRVRSVLSDEAWQAVKRDHARLIRAVGAERFVLDRLRLKDDAPVSLETLAALCQRCHILHDKPEHLRRRRLTYLARRAPGDLFTGPYC